MPQRIRIADRLKKQSAEQLITMAGGVTNRTDDPGALATCNAAC